MSHFPLYLVGLAILFAFIGIFRSQTKDASTIGSSFIRWILFFSIGLQGLWAFYGHVFLPDQAAADIGWKPSPFQYEVGVANLGLAVIGFVGAFAGRGFQLAATLMSTCFLWGAAVGHIRQMILAHNFEPGNAGAIFYTDIGIPLALLILIGIRHRKT